jgi:N-carbamoylputrescine amidase
LSINPPSYAPGAIGLLQYDGDAHFGDYEHNLAALTRLAEQAVANGSKIVVMPEGSLYGYASREELWCKPGMTTFRGKNCRDVSTVAERVPGGRSSEYWSAFARRHGVYVLFSVLEEDGGRFYNTMGIAAPDGGVGRYRKRRLYYTDQAYAEPGTEPFILDTPYGRFGLLICLDATDSPYFREYKAAGASAVIVSMDWDDDPHGQHSAVKKFRQWAAQDGIDIYAADSAPWDGAGKYPASGGPRERDGLPATGVGEEGVSTHRFVYPR